LETRESAEMYLETIYLLEKNHGHAHGVDIAEKLGVSKASVTKAMKKLQNEGLIYRESYGSITLTDLGSEVSVGIYRKHKLIFAYLKHSLGISDQEASENACRMEHTVSDKVLNSIEVYLEKFNIEI
jgi:DtxR family transcriptional regulator, Mn-dependent transcriptional regulator